MQGRPYPPQKNGNSDHELVNVSAHIHHEFYAEEFSSHLSLNELQASATHWVKPPKHVGASSSSKFLVTRPTMLYHVLPCVPTNHDIVTCDTVCQTAAVRRFAFSRSRSFPKGERRPSRLGSIYTRHIRHSKLLWQPHNRPTTTPGLVPSWSAIFCLSDAWCCFLFFILMIPDIHEKSVMHTYTLDCTISIHGMRVCVNIFIYMCVCVCPCVRNLYGPELIWIIMIVYPGTMIYHILQSQWIEHSIIAWQSGTLNATFSKRNSSVNDAVLFWQCL